MSIPPATILGLLLAAFDAREQTLEVGKQAYEARCVGCHGSDGAGGAHGPGIVDIGQPRAASRQALRDLIRSGIPEAGMPAFAIPDAELDAVVSYLEVLRSPATDHPTPGDAVAGERFFTGEGHCTRCHMVRGRGGILGPDLSNLARERRTPQIDHALREPGTSRSFRALSLRMRDGAALRGIAKYETPFDLGV